MHDSKNQPRYKFESKNLKKTKKQKTWHISKSLRSFDGLSYRSKMDMKPTAQICVI